MSCQSGQKAGSCSKTGNSRPVLGYGQRTAICRRNNVFQEVTMQVPQHFDVSLTPSATTTISVMQGDGLRLLVAHLKKDAEPWPVPDGISAGLSYELPDRAPGYYDRMNDGTPACVINGDQISVLLEPMLTECPGPVRASIILRDPDGVQIATFPFHILVEQVPGLVHAENMRAPVHRFDGKIYYGGVAGIPQPLGLGNGLQAEKQKDGSLLLVADGNTPVRGVDYWTAADQEAIVQQVIAALGTPVFGRVDGENNIILTGELADGTYTLKYEDGEGNVTEIGTAKIGSSYINQITISTDTDGSVYNGKGWIENKRINSSGAVSDVGSYGYTGVTGFIPIADGDIIRTSANIVDPNGSTQQSIGFYDADKNLIARHQYRNATNKFDYDLFVINNDKSITFKHDNAYLDLAKPAAYVRFCFVGITDGAIITTNEEITEQGGSSGMGNSGSIELVWSDGIKLDKTTGAEGSGDGYAASQHIELVDGYTYTFDQHMDSNGFVYGGINICYYDANGTGLGYELLWDSVAQAQSKALSPISGAKTFRVRLYYGEVLRPGSYSVIYAINA